MIQAVLAVTIALHFLGLAPQTSQAGSTGDIPSCPVGPGAPIPENMIKPKYPPDGSARAGRDKWRYASALPPTAE
jgi:hypothetical protein